jgi:hypothetical protein
VVGSYRHRNKHSGSVQSEEFLEYLIASNFSRRDVHNGIQWFKAYRIQPEN